MKVLKFFHFFLIIFFSNLNAQNKDEYFVNKANFAEKFIKIKKDTITFLISKSKSIINKPTILFIQGSGPLPIVFYDDKSVNSIIPFSIKEYSDKYNFVIIARKGIPLIGTYDKDATGYLNKQGKIPFEYTRNDNLEYRVWQVKQVLNYLHKNFNKESIFVIGHSEGYRVASKLSENNRKISKLVCMSADPFNRITENILRERIGCFEKKDDVSSQLEIDKLIDDYKNLSRSKIEYKNSIGFVNWLSYNENFSYESLKKFKNPILIVYGGNDIGSIHNDLLPFLLPKTNITLKAYPNYGHNFEKKNLILIKSQLKIATIGMKFLMMYKIGL
ncbi:hypothetical protein ACQ9BO_04170 [Flavobacterium sp. P21]|uniref:hypothetical protein n=1 Tax=Flavobacterium sp. P21 TaxID=3423948 RepID=UPI003D6771F8